MAGSGLSRRWISASSTCEPAVSASAASSASEFSASSTVPVGPDADQHDPLEAQLAVLDLGDVLRARWRGRRRGAAPAGPRGRTGRRRSARQRGRQSRSSRSSKRSSRRSSGSTTGSSRTGWSELVLRSSGPRVSRERRRRRLSSALPEGSRHGPLRDQHRRAGQLQVAVRPAVTVSRPPGTSTTYAARRPGRRPSAAGPRRRPSRRTRRCRRTGSPRRPARAPASRRAGRRGDDELDVDAVRVRPASTPGRLRSSPGVGEVVDEHHGVRVADVDLDGRPGAGRRPRTVRSVPGSAGRAHVDGDVAVDRPAGPLHPVAGRDRQLARLGPGPRRRGSGRRPGCRCRTSRRPSRRRCGSP